MTKEELIKRIEGILVTYARLYHQDVDSNTDHSTMIKSLEENSEAIKKLLESQRCESTPKAICGLPLSVNPHPNAGKTHVTPDFLEIGTEVVCIPCTVKSRHQWAERALKAENELSQFEEVKRPENPYPEDYRNGKPYVRAKDFEDAIDAYDRGEKLYRKVK